MQTLLIAFIGLMGLGSAQTPTPSAADLQAKAQERMRQDFATYSRDDLRALEQLYQQANRDLAAPEAKAILQRVVKDYPKANRAGSATLYLAQLSSGAEREAYLKTAIRSYADTWYGDGVQVGAFARFQLAALYAADGRMDEARRLASEIVSKFPGAIDHRGRLLADGLRELELIKT